MNDKNEKILTDFLSHADEMREDIFEDTQSMLGTIPFIFKIMGERPENFVLSGLVDYRTLRPGNLSPKVSELVAIASAAGAGADNCLKVHIQAALKEGATRDEIIDTIMIAAMIGRTKVLASGLRHVADILPDNISEIEK